MNPTGLVCTILKSDTAVAALVGDRVYGVVIGQMAALPQVRILTVSAETNNTKDGAGCNDSYRMQIDIYADTMYQAIQIDRAVRTKLDYFSGPVDVVGDRFYNISIIAYLDSNDGIEPERDVFRRSSDYTVKTIY